MLLLGHVGIARFDEDSSLLTLVFVRHGARGRGVASTLLSAVGPEIDRLGLPRRTVLHVFSENARAKHLYASHGFADTGARVPRADGVGSTEVWAADACVQHRHDACNTNRAPPSSGSHVAETIARWVHEDVTCTATDACKRNMNMYGQTEAELAAEVDEYVGTLRGGVNSIWAFSIAAPPPGTCGSGTAAPCSRPPCRSRPPGCP